MTAFFPIAGGSMSLGIKYLRCLTAKGVGVPPGSWFIVQNALVGLGDISL